MSVRKICTWIIGSGWIKRGHDIGHLVLTLLPLLVSLHPMSAHRLRGEIEGGHLRRFPSGRRGKGERPKERAGKKGHFRVCSYYYMHSTFARVVSFPGHGPRRHAIVGGERTDAEGSPQLDGVDEFCVFVICEMILPISMFNP